MPRRTGYLVHLTRVPTGHADAVQRLLRATLEETKIKAIFAQLDQRAKAWSVWRLNATDFEAFPYVEERPSTHT